MSTFSTCVLDLPDGPRNPLYGNMPLGFKISPIEEATRSASEMKREGWDGSLSSSNFQSFICFSSLIVLWECLARPCKFTAVKHKCAGCSPQSDSQPAQIQDTFYLAQVLAANALRLGDIFHLSAGRRFAGGRDILCSRPLQDFLRAVNLLRSLTVYRRENATLL